MATWDEAYSSYRDTLQNGQMSEQTIRNLYSGLSQTFVDNIIKIKAELDEQQAAGTKEYWSTGRMASVDNATWDNAFRLAEAGLSSVQQLGRRNVSSSTQSESGEMQTTSSVEYYNKETGEAIQNWDHLSQNAPLRTRFNYHFQDDGTVIPYTSTISSDWVQFREEVAKPVGGILLAAYGIPALSPYVSAVTGLAQGTAGLAAATAATASVGTSVISGKSFEETLKAATVAGLTAGATAGYADTIGQTLGFDAGSVASKAAGQAIIAGAKAGITDENILTNMATAAVTSILSNKDGVIKATDEDLAAGLDPRYGSNQTYDAFMMEAMTPEARAAIEAQINPSLMGPQTAENLSTGFESYMNESAFDATANQGSLAKEVEDTSFNLTDKDIKTGIKIAGTLLAGKEVVDKTIGKTTTTTGLGSRIDEDIYRDAPIAGFKMVEYQDGATGSSKYVPFIGDQALLPPPVGYTRSSYAKGGFVTRR